jgi:peptidoglycan/xylan/chitin deacetylase (PgdA/CDA1 family)
LVERPQERRPQSGSGARHGAEAGTGIPGPLPAGLGGGFRGRGLRLSPRRLRWLLRLLLLLTIGTVLALGILLRGSPPAPPIRIRVRGSTLTVPAGTALGWVIRSFSLTPPAGDLLDVEGVVLHRGVYPGRVLVDGVAVPDGTKLAQGDAVTVQPGKNHTEGILSKAVRIAGGEVQNPQFTLGRAPGVQVIRTGKISGKFVSSVFRPTGSIKPPKAVALTFDDGPYPTNTLKVLRVLKRYRVKATFFVIGRSASFHPRAVRAEIAAGMEIGSHSWSHPYLTPFKDLPRGVITSEINQTEHELLSLGQSSGLFRPPGGTFSPRVIDLARAADVRLVLWSVDPKDWLAGRTKKQIVGAVLSRVTTGSIVILHDGGGDRSATIAALPAIIKGIRAKGLELVTIGQGSA